MKALVEFYRVIKPGGMICTVVPDSIKTFDRNRPTTSVNHMLKDFSNDVEDNDPTYVHDYILGIDQETMYYEKAQSDYDREKRDN